MGVPDKAWLLILLLLIDHRWWVVQKLSAFQLATGRVTGRGWIPLTFTKRSPADLMGIQIDSLLSIPRGCSLHLLTCFPLRGWKSIKPTRVVEIRNSPTWMQIWFPSDLHSPIPSRQFGELCILYLSDLAVHYFRWTALPLNLQSGLQFLKTTRHWLGVIVQRSNSIMPVKHRKVVYE